MTIIHRKNKFLSEILFDKIVTYYTDVPHNLLLAVSAHMQFLLLCSFMMLTSEKWNVSRIGKTYRKSHMEWTVAEILKLNLHKELMWVLYTLDKYPKAHKATYIPCQFHQWIKAVNLNNSKDSDNEKKQMKKVTGLKQFNEFWYCR